GFAASTPPAPPPPEPGSSGTVNAQPARPAIAARSRDRTLIARRFCDALRYAVTMKRRPGGAGLTRRDWVRFISAYPAAVALLGCGDDLEPLRDGGVAILEPSSSGFVVAIWAARGERAHVVLRSGGVIVV